MSIHQKSTAVTRLDMIKAGFGEGEVQRKATVRSISYLSDSIGAGKPEVYPDDPDKKTLWWSLGMSLAAILLFVIALKNKWIKI